MATRITCPKCNRTYVYLHDAGNKVRTCDHCGIVLARPVGDGGHLENVQLNVREFSWSERLLLSVFPEGVIW